MDLIIPNKIIKYDYSEMPIRTRNNSLDNEKRKLMEITNVINKLEENQLIIPGGAEHITFWRQRVQNLTHFIADLESRKVIKK